MANKIVVTIVVLIVLVVAVIGVVLLKDYLGKKVVGEGEEELTITEKKQGVIATKELDVNTEEELLSEIDKLVEERFK